MGDGPVLRLTQISLSGDKYRVDMTLKGHGPLQESAFSIFAFSLTPQDREDIRWYLEDYPETTRDPGEQIARRVEGRMAEIGKDLFAKIFQYDEDTREIWSAIRNALNEARMEIVTEVQEATAIPWELMREPKTDTCLALRAQSFVRTSGQRSQRPTMPDVETGTIRILLAICRPRGGMDVPFRSLAIRLIRGLSETKRELYQLDVLRPPTFEELGRRLRDAKDGGEPYHVVHFDGHGVFLDIEELFEQSRDKSKSAAEVPLADLIRLDSRRFSPEVIYPGGRRKGRHGYLAFDNAKSEYNIRLVDGPELGRLLRDAGVSVLVLNACRSAHAEAPEEPVTASGEESPGDVHAEVRTYGSLAQEVMDAGMAGTVAMRYNVYVDTAARFMNYLYYALARGQSLGQAATQGRKRLNDDPRRETVYGPTPLQDWCVPVVYEAAPVALFPESKGGEDLHIQFDLEEAQAYWEGIEPSLPKRPDVGFFGRDETLLALDRAFDTQSIVLLHAFAGSGKTSAAAEFARWYKITGGLDLKGRVLFTSFEQYKCLPRVVDQLEPIYEQFRIPDEIPWLAMDDAQRRKIALQILSQLPILWIWDSVEPVTGFPAGTQSAWSEEEQKELIDFPREARETKARFLLTSRRDERAWLGDLPERISVCPMRMHERLQLARALAEKHNRKLADVDGWLPLLRYTEGNPLTITVVVGQALRDGLTKRRQIEEFVDRLRAGEAQLEDDPVQGRSRSLGASLQYGFEHAFTDEEHRILALLHLFQGFVNVDVLRGMGTPEAEWCLNEIRGLTRERGISLLDRAAEVGLLTAHGGGYYSIHPALPWFFREFFGKHYPDSSDGDAEPPARRAERAFVEAMGELGDYYIDRYEGGNRDVIAALTFEEANLLQARRLARQNGWWVAVTGAMQGLHSLYGHTGRRAEWKRLVEEVVPDFVDPKTDSPLPGREEYWHIFTNYLACLAREERDWEEAERLWHRCVEWSRKRAAPALKMPAESLDDTQRNDIRTLSVSLQGLGHVQREVGRVECVKSCEEALKLAECIGNNALAATCAFNLGNVYEELPILRDLEKAEHWYQRSLDLTKESDRLGRAQCLTGLGYIAWERFAEAQAANEPKENLLKHLNQALRLYQEALEMYTENAVADDLAVMHNQLGLIYMGAEQTDRALYHYNQAIQLYESMVKPYAAGQTRFNVALALATAGRLQDALSYARAALRNFETYGDRAAEDIQKAKNLIARIKANPV